MELKRLLGEKKITQRELAGLLGVSTKSVCCYVHGTRRPSPKRAAQIAKILCLSVEETWKLFYSENAIQGKEQTA